MKLVEQVVSNLSKLPWALQVQATSSRLESEYHAAWKLDIFRFEIFKLWIEWIENSWA